MNIAGISPSISTLQSTEALSTASGVASLKMLDNALNTNEQMGQSMIKMMENSVTPYLGSNFDMSV